MCLFELGDTDDRWMVCCGEVHCMIGTLCFLSVDASVLFIFMLTYTLVLLGDANWRNVVPMLALLVSMPFCVLGYVGLLRRNARLLGWHSRRNAYVAIFCLVWMVVCMTFGDIAFVGLVWVVGAPVYGLGYHVTAVCTRFYLAHY